MIELLCDQDRRFTASLSRLISSGKNGTGIFLWDGDGHLAEIEFYPVFRLFAEVRVFYNLKNLRSLEDYIGSKGGA